MGRVKEMEQNKFTRHRDYVYYSFEFASSDKELFLSHYWDDVNVLEGRFSSASRLIIKALFAVVLVLNYNKNRLSCGVP